MLKQNKNNKKLCISCKTNCEYVGTINTRNEEKVYCCDCYSKLDEFFIRRLWCKECNKVKLENIKMENLQKYYVPIDYVCSLLEQNCNYSPKRTYLEIQNMLRIAKKEKEVK